MSEGLSGGGVADAWGITVWALGDHHFLEVDEAEAGALRAATGVLVEAVGIEQKLDLVINNLMDLERELADRALVLIHRGLQDGNGLLDDQLAFSRRLLNLLSSARTYIDHVKHHVSGMHPGDRAVAAAVAAAFSERYDASFAYRLMEAIRNYSQHRGMPIQGFTYDRRWLGDEVESHVEINVRLSLDAAALRSDGKFKGSVLDELDGRDGLDLKLCVREYVEELGRVHVAVRDINDLKVTEATDRLAGARSRYAAAIGEAEAPVGLALVRRRMDGTRDHLGGLAATPIRYLAELRKRTSHTGALSKQVLTLRPLSPWMARAAGT